MEDVLDVYQRPYDPKRPQVCLDEACKQLLGHTTQPLPAQPAQATKPGHVERVDYEYERHGVANLFMMCEPLVGRRHVAVRERRTAVDWASVVKALVDEQYAAAEVIVLVMDNLNIRPGGTRACGAYMKPSRQQKPSALRTSWRFTTRPSMALGSTWPRSS